MFGKRYRIYYINVYRHIRTGRYFYGKPWGSPHARNLAAGTTSHNSKLVYRLNVCVDS